MESTKVPFVFDFTRPPNIMNTTSTAASLIPVNISMEASYPQLVNLSFIPSYSLPDMIESTEQVTLQPILEGISVSDTLFLRLCSAIEGVTLFIIIREILPDLWNKRKSSGYFCRLLLFYSLIFVFICIRFYDFLETNIFRTMSDGAKIRFLLYFIGPLENIFDLSLVSLAVESLIDLSSFLPPEKQMWTIFGGLVVGIPLVYLLIMITIWESSFSIKGLISGGIVEGTLSTLAILVLLFGIYFYARRKLHVLTNLQVFKTKLILCILSVTLIGSGLFLILMLSQAEIILDDLCDSIVKLLICGSYVCMIKKNWISKNIFPSLVPNAQGDSTTIVHDTLREEANGETV